MYIALVADKWVYGLLREMSPLFRGIFIAFQASIAAGFYKLGNILNNKIHPGTRKSVKKMLKKVDSKEN